MNPDYNLLIAVHVLVVVTSFLAYKAMEMTLLSNVKEEDEKK